MDIPLILKVNVKLSIISLSFYWNLVFNSISLSVIEIKAFQIIQHYLLICICSTGQQILPLLPGFPVFQPIYKAHISFQFWLRSDILNWILSQFTSLPFFKAFRSTQNRVQFLCKAIQALHDLTWPLSSFVILPTHVVLSSGGPYFSNYIAIWKKKKIKSIKI